MIPGSPTTRNSPAPGEQSRRAAKVQFDDAVIQKTPQSPETKGKVPGRNFAARENETVPPDPTESGTAVNSQPIGSQSREGPGPEGGRRGICRIRSDLRIQVAR